MRTIVDDLGNEVRYLVREVDGSVTSLEAVPEDASVDGVELVYHCPYCDCPNAVAYSTPVPSGCFDTCDHCEATHDITPKEGGEGRRLFHYDDFEERARNLERKREARLVGERNPVSAVQSLSRARAVLIPTGITAFLALCAGLLAFAVFGPLFIAIGNLVYGTSLILFACAFFGVIYHGDRQWKQYHRDKLPDMRGLSPF